MNSINDKNIKIISVSMVFEYYFIWLFDIHRYFTKENVFMS